MATIVLSGHGTGFRLVADPSLSVESDATESQVTMVSRSGTRVVTVKDATKISHAA